MSGRRGWLVLWIFAALSKPISCFLRCDCACIRCGVWQERWFREKLRPAFMLSMLPLLNAYGANSIRGVLSSPLTSSPWAYLWGWEMLSSPRVMPELPQIMADSWFGTSCGEIRSHMWNQTDPPLLSPHTSDDQKMINDFKHPKRADKPTQQARKKQNWDSSDDIWLEKK